MSQVETKPETKLTKITKLTVEEEVDGKPVEIQIKPIELVHSIHLIFISF